VLGVGLLLVAFPVAHGMILTALYLPVALMLAGLILRGVAFDFRAKAQSQYKRTWDFAFYMGSLITALSQGYMLGVYVIGLENSLAAFGFALLTSLCIAAGYAFIGGCWLILKTEGELQRRAVGWARKALWGTAIGIGAVSIATPMVSERIFAKWFSLPEFMALLPIPLITGALLVFLYHFIGTLPRSSDRWSWVPFVVAIAVFVLCFQGLAYSFYPYVVPERLTIYEAAAARESLMIILAGTVVVLPAIIGYTVLAYYIFRGKATELRYD
jgi:cytochrome d ubiquinol oxidase subunit II